nr:hypothetical protein [Qipengyuania algicida]
MRVDRLAATIKGNGCDYLGRVKVQGPSNVHQFDHIEPSFAKLNPRDKLSVQSELIAQLLLRHAKLGTPRCKVRNQLAIAVIAKSGSCESANHSGSVGQLDRRTETVTSTCARVTECTSAIAVSKPMHLARSGKQTQ